MIVAPSILSANFNTLQKDIECLENKGVKFIHLDIMDGKFVPNFTFGPVVLKGLNYNMIKDVHLMVFDPVLYAKYFMQIKPDYITFHYEAVDNVFETINQIKALGTKVGISIKPNTDVSVLDEYLELIDLVLVMSVEPGFGGQKFIDSALPKLRYLSDKKKENNYNYLIEVDGGVNEETAKLCADNGCEIVVAGTYIFQFIKKEDYEGLEKTISYLEKL